MNYHKLDPEFMERFENFAYNEVPNEEDAKLDETTRYTVILAALIGCQGIEQYEVSLHEALNAGYDPIRVKEIVYQSVDYLGVGRMLPFLRVTNEVMLARNIPLPLEGQATTTLENRLEKGIETTAKIFGPHDGEPWKDNHMTRWLQQNCFGDYYTRTGLNIAEREMATFCFLSAQGGCEPQATGHARANMKMGNDKDFMLRVASQFLPYIGYPRTLNAISYINNAAKSLEE